MLLAEIVTKSYFVDLSAHPRWLVILVGTIAAVVVLWILLKVMKVAAWLLLFAVLVAGVLWAGWELVK